MDPNQKVSISDPGSNVLGFLLCCSGALFFGSSPLRRLLHRSAPPAWPLVTRARPAIEALHVDEAVAGRVREYRCSDQHPLCCLAASSTSHRFGSLSPTARLSLAKKQQLQFSEFQHARLPLCHRRGWPTVMQTTSDAGFLCCSENDLILFNRWRWAVGDSILASSEQHLLLSPFIYIVGRVVVGFVQTRAA
ncbi:uncharacterized protein LOC130998084 [Salvia miltiorrhiza]|uniref:uncharacterized protein LOC130998084 n=1 Tax=Salvia miltiorrhiza TaxID=226208 RepID=UPI0025AD302B|nr:uncharacterized protein LOC130998084 [Salvia miltiorrhiza]